MKLLWLAIAILTLFAEQPLLAADADPAVIHANASKSGDIGYHEDWFGKGDSRLHYVEAGKGPLIIFYHGFPSHWYSWFDQMEALKGQYRVVAVDGLGAGRSAKPHGLSPYKVAALAKQLDALARHLNGNRRFILIGHDWGAALGLAYAQAYPNRLDAVIGLSAPPYNLFLDLAAHNAEQQKRSAYMQRFRALTLADVRSKNMGQQIATSAYAELSGSGALSESELALFTKPLSDPETMNGGMNWYRANIREFEAISRADYWPRHNRPITVPTLLLWGDRDETFVPETLQHMPNFAKQLTIIKLPDVGHWASIEKAELANKAIADFLRCKVGVGGCPVYSKP
jgi:epoxide hydrolase 4